MLYIFKIVLKYFILSGFGASKWLFITKCATGILKSKHNQVTSIKVLFFQWKGEIQVNICNYITKGISTAG